MNDRTFQLTQLGDTSWRRKWWNEGSRITTCTGRPKMRLDELLLSHLLHRCDDHWPEAGGRKLSTVGAAIAAQPST